MTQIKCPNCGGYKTQADYTFVGSFLIWVYFFIAVIAGIRFGVLHWAAGLIVFFVILVLLIGITNFTHKCYCPICGYRWKTN